MNAAELKTLTYLSIYAEMSDDQRDARLEQKIRLFSDFTGKLTELSTCRRLKVGCIILPLDLSTMLSIGYNGLPAGENNSTCDGAEGHCPCVHAEANALIKLRDFRDCLLISSVSPCRHCAGLIVNSGVVRAVGYLDEYRDQSGLDRLRAAGILTVKLPS
jgi:deoxycytidylate deaminase